MNTNYFQASKENPYHLSVGTVLLDDQNRVACHYVEKMPAEAPGEFRGYENVHLLMRETMEQGESIEDTLHRGLREEFGATGDIIAFLGSLEGAFRGDLVTMTKTTLYFLVRMTDMDQSNRSHEDIEGESEIQLLEMSECITKMQDQWGRLHSETLHESEIVRRACDHINSQ